MMAEQIFLLLKLASMLSHLEKSEPNKIFFFFFEDRRWPLSFGSSLMILLSPPKPRVSL